ncbi:hypothetical protein HDU98_003444, partial [Podochytrium sp. JEL0797]
MLHDKPTVSSPLLQPLLLPSSCSTSATIPTAAAAVGSSSEIPPPPPIDDPIIAKMLEGRRVMTDVDAVAELERQRRMYTML